jgi:23S rRNA pseudouridine1911/1915/1917 synthase
MNEPLAVLYEDAHLLAADKPAGLLTQGGAGGRPTLEGLVREHLAPGAVASVYVGTVHRLDRSVSGVVIWAKTEKAARRLSALFAAREAVKEYWAVVETRAKIDAREGVWEDWLSDGVGEGGVVRPVEAGSPRAKRALTKFRVGEALKLPGQSAWLRLWPETGRTHQLRVQSGLRGLPVLGDTTYGSSRPFGPGPAIALHARSLAFRHPVTRREVVVTAPVPSGWAGEGVVLER